MKKLDLIFYTCYINLLYLLQNNRRPQYTIKKNYIWCVSLMNCDFCHTTTQNELLMTGRRCHVCGDNDNGIPCDTRSIYTGNLQQCGPGKDFCMTDLIHNGQPFPTIFKR